LDSTIGIQKQFSKGQSMDCPCCGSGIELGDPACSCGARFVGAPLDETPLKVQRLGPAMISVLLLAVVVGLSLAFTKWLAFGGVLVLWSSWRAVRLADKEPEWYGGYRTAASTLTVTILAGLILGAYGISRIPVALENRRIRQIAATQALCYHVKGLLEAYKKVHNQYPKNAQEYEKAMGEALPLDYWDKSIKYQGYTEAIAEGTNPSSLSRTGLPPVNFELRSAGPDGKLGTADDVIMVDGVFYSNSEVKSR
jgi:hypothetical protein